MKKYLIIAFIALGFSATAQQSPTNKTRSNNDFSQVDNYLIGLKRLGIPTSETDNLDAAGLPQNAVKIIFNTTLGKLRIYNPLTGTWADATDLSAYYTKSQIDDAFNGKFDKTGGAINGSINLKGDISMGGNDHNILRISTEGDGQGANAFVSNGLGGSISFQGYNFNFNGINSYLNTNTFINGNLTLGLGAGYGYFDNYGWNGTGSGLRMLGRNSVTLQANPDADIEQPGNTDAVIDLKVFDESGLKILRNKDVRVYNNISDINGTPFLKQGDALPLVNSPNLPDRGRLSPVQLLTRDNDGGTIGKLQLSELLRSRNGIVDNDGYLELGGDYTSGINLGSSEHARLVLNNSQATISHGDASRGIGQATISAQSNAATGYLQFFTATALGQKGIGIDGANTNNGIIVNDAVAQMGMQYNDDISWANAGPQTMMPKKYVDNNFIKNLIATDNAQNASFNLNGNGLLNGDLKTNSMHVNSIELGTNDGDLKIAPQGTDKIKITGNLNIGTSTNIAIAEITESYSTFHGAVIADNNTSGAYNYFESQDNTVGKRGTYRSNSWGFNSGTGYLNFVIPEFEGGHNITFPVPKVNANVAYQSDLEGYLPLTGGTMNGDLATVNDRSFAMYKTEDQGGDRIVWRQEYLKWIKDGETWFDLNQGSFRYNGNTDFHGSQNVYGNLWVGTMPNITGQPYQFVVKDQTSGNMSVINDKFLSLGGGVMEGRISGASDAGTWSFGRNSESGKFNFDFNNNIIAFNGGLNLSNSLKAGNGISADGGEGSGGFNVPIGVSGSQPMLGFRSRGYGKSAGIGYSSGGLDFWIKGENNTDLTATGIRPLRIADNGKAEFLDDVELIDATKGIILHSPNGTRYRLTINDTGDFVKTAL
ncbi:hypothetical protein [Pedobacter jeongneungensis]|uniref:hypothetical protein n=1 Tax=Pedobacter jeongneungensis TaxID=947309 RepID=UPI00046AA7EA|nr:hypothetical protein [Pedobacter jeongneungensis]